jgi:hypothetical protein
VLRGFSSVCNRTLDLARLTRQRAADLPEEFVRGCTILAQQLMAAGPTELLTREPQDPYYWPPGTVWDAALELMDAAIGFLPVAGDERLQFEFEHLVSDAFKTGSAAVQQAISVQVNPWHWFRSHGRRTLHDQLFWRDARHGVVVKSAICRLNCYTHEQRAEICRNLLQRDDYEQPQILFTEIGEIVGSQGLIMVGAQRAPMAPLTEEVITSFGSFPLLYQGELHRAVLRAVMRGLVRSAQKFYKQAVLAPDFGRWALAIWAQGRGLLPAEQHRRGIILLALHWLAGCNGFVDPAFAHWWRAILPLLRAAVIEGSRHDASEVFSQFRHADYLGVMLPENLFELVEALCTRLRSAPEDTSSDAEAASVVARSTWKEIADYAADSIETLRERKLLNDSAKRETAYRLLTDLATTPHPSRTANVVLQRLQSSESYYQD